METRESMRQLGDEVLAKLRHGVFPPRKRQLFQADVPGLKDFTHEALWASVWARPGLDMHDRMVATLSVLGSLQRMHQLRTYFNSALNFGLDPLEVLEVAIQVSLQAGFPATVNAMELLRDVLETRGEETTFIEIAEVPVEDLDRRGRALFIELGGELPAWIDEDSPAAHLARVELRFAYGEILHRPGLDRRSRVIVAIAASVALRDDAELARWLRAGDRVGLDKAQRDEVMMQCAYYGGMPPARRALDAARDQG